MKKGCTYKIMSLYITFLFFILIIFISAIYSEKLHSGFSVVVQWSMTNIEREFDL